jgi:tetratricopeptide (TPR) repeat protein
VTEDQERLAYRLFALAGLWLLLSGLLLVLSFVVVALVAFAALFSVAISIGAVAAVRRLELEERLWTLLASATEAAQRMGGRLRNLRVPRRVRNRGVQQRVRRVGTRARRRAAGMPARANALVARALQAYALAVYRLRNRTARRIHAGRRSQALQLNELGAELRRQGAPEEAAEQHRVALEIARDLGDDEAEALTLNSLALALAQGGAEAEAVEHLEQARVVLRELGDEKHEAQVIANLGIVYRRQGLSEEAVSLLHEALDKLPPGSWAYRQVEEELQRAS